jgi:hypothetical protein
VIGLSSAVSETGLSLDAETDSLPDEVHEETDRLEHFISERFEDRVAAILGDPEIDPHGHVILPEICGRRLPRGNASRPMAAPETGGYQQRFRSEPRGST